MTYMDKAGNVKNWCIVKRNKQYGIIRNDLLPESALEKSVCIQWADKTATVIPKDEAVEVVKAVYEMAYEALETFAS